MRGSRRWPDFPNFQGLFKTLQRFLKALEGLYLTTFEALERPLKALGNLQVPLKDFERRLPAKAFNGLLKVSLKALECL